ncbi:MAG: EAL domain-containing protein [Aeromonas sp.]
MRQISSLWKSLLLLLVPILISLPLSELASEPWAQHLLKRKQAEIRLFQQTRHQELDQVLREQMKRFVFNCQAGDMALLRDPTFYNGHIRLQGLQLASGAGCSSLGTAILPAAVGLPTGPLLDDKGLSATISKFHTEQELVAYYRTGGNTIYWVLNNSWIHSLINTPCNNCFFVTFTSKNAAQIPSLFPRGNRAIKDEPDNLKLKTTATSTLLKNTLWAGTALRAYAKQQVYMVGLWSGTGIGVLLVALYWLQRNYRYSLKGLLQTGLKKREFVPFYQPIVDSRTQQVVGFEALLRWQRGNRLIPPNIFIEYVEEQGLILPITEQLLEQVIDDLPQLPANQWVSVNLVATHIEQPLLRNLLAKHHNPSPDQLTFELTERKPIIDINAAIQEITELQQMGYHFKLDDFGTGYGGFAYLQRLGIRQIKIDKMFVDTIGTNDLKRDVLDAIIIFGRESGMEMIAEGVETQQQIDYLNQMGVFLIQGYIIAKPMPLNMLSSWQQRWQTEVQQEAQQELQQQEQQQGHPQHGPNKLTATPHHHPTACSSATRT